MFLISPFAIAADPLNRSQIVRHGDLAAPLVALTFDDGPSPRYTKAVLAILRAYRVKATFFVLGTQAARHPDLVAAIAAEGHLVANHSWDHPKRLSIDQWRSQIMLTQEAIQNASVTPSRYYRPPHGLVTPAIVQLCETLDMTIVLYTILSSDWSGARATQLVEQVGNGLRPGGIVVLHDAGGNRSETVVALPRIIERLKQRKLRPVRLDELLSPSRTGP